MPPRRPRWGRSRHHPTSQSGLPYAILTGMPPLVSVVVPVFNGMPHLPALVDSLLAQDYPEVEFIFSEGGGTDASAEYLAGLQDHRVRVIHQPPGTSAAANWSAASLAAQGEFTKLVCQDDVLYPTALTDQVSDLTAHPTAVMAIAKRDIIDSRGTVVFRNRGLAGLPGGPMPGADAIRASYLHGTNVIGEPLAVLFRTEALKVALPWEDEIPLMLDLSMYSKVAPTGLVVPRFSPVGAFRVSTSSWSTRIAAQQRAQTKQWQANYAQHARPNPSGFERTRALVGRNVSTAMRRAAYAILGTRT
jgi:hypothetical protein